MNKNRKFLKSLLVALIGAGAMISISQAVTLKFNYDVFGRNYQDGVFSTGNVSPIHFADNGNDFGGFFYFKDDVGAGKSANEWDENEPGRSCECTDGEGNPIIDEEGNPILFCTNQGTQVTYSCDGDNHEILDEPAPYSVDANGETYSCRGQVKGFYYNSQRGERLRPLDEDTFDTWKNLGNGDAYMGGFKGGIYTRCSKSGYNFETILSTCETKQPSDVDGCVEKAQEEYYDTHSYYGSVIHDYNGEEWHLIMGVNYKQNNPRFEPKTGADLKLSPTFQRIDNKFPIGFIYDLNGGLGFVGCRVNDGANSLKIILEQLKLDQIDSKTIEDVIVYDSTAQERGNMIKHGELDCKDVGSAVDSLIGLIVDGLVGMGTNTNSSSIAGNTSSDKTQYFGSVDVNNATLINFTKQKAESLCRGKWVNDPNKCGNNEKICCIDNKSNGSTIAATKDKTLIVKNGNVEVKPITDGSDTNYYDIFIDGGDLLIDETNDTNKFVIGRNGFITNETVEQFNSSVIAHYEGDNTSPYDGEGIAVASVIRGNFIVNGDVKNSNNNIELKNKYFIYGKFTTNKTYDELKEVFARRCNAGIDNTDEYNPNRCPEYEQDNLGYKKSPYQGAFLVVVDQNYDSPLYW